MNIKIQFGIDAMKSYEILLNKNLNMLSKQFKMAINNFYYDIKNESAFLITCERNTLPILWFAFQVNHEEKTINTPFFYTLSDIPKIIKGRSIKLASNAFVEIVKEYNDYSFYIMAIPKVSKIVNKLLSPPMEYVGVLHNYFIYDTKNEDAFFYWKPSTKQKKGY